MARKKKADEPGGDAEAPAAAPAAKGGGKSNLVPALIIAAGLVAGGFLMGRGGASPVAAADGTTTTTAEGGGVAILDPVTMNLADGHYLKLTLGLQLKKGVDPKEFKSTGQAAKALDIAMSQLSHYSSTDLQPPKKRDEVRAHLSESIAEVFEGEVLRTYVTEWVVQ